jgi:hypothetical protein
MPKDKMRIREIVKSIVKLIFIVTIQVAQFYIIVNWAIFNDVVPQFAGFLGGFWIGKAYFKEEFHTSTLTMCTLITCLTFISTCKIIPNLQTSIIIQSIAGVFLALAFSIFEVVRKEYGWFERAVKNG